MIRINDIKVFCLDVDGTLTDGTYTLAESGEVSKSFNTRDFYAVSRLLEKGIRVVIATGAKDNVIDAKIASSHMKNDIVLIKDSRDKYSDVSDWLHANSLSWDNVAFIGDAENDILAMSAAGWSACPFDSIPEIKELSYYISEMDGGRAAVHDCIRYFFGKRGWKWTTDMDVNT